MQLPVAAILLSVTLALSAGCNSTSRVGGAGAAGGTTGTGGAGTGGAAGGGTAGVGARGTAGTGETGGGAGGGAAGSAAAGQQGGAATDGSSGSSGQGGITALGGAGGAGGLAGARGAGGGAGVGGQPADGGTICSDLEAQYAAAMPAALVCDVNASGQCQQLVPPILGRFSLCSTGCFVAWVNDASALNAIKLSWERAGCAGVITCPNIFCDPAPSSGCAATDGGGGRCSGSALISPTPTD